MNKIMYLYDFEFKRNSSNYRYLVYMFCFMFVFNLIDSLKNYNHLINNELKNKSIEVLSETIGSTSFNNILSIHGNVEMYFISGLLFCIGYSIIIWKKDFSGKNKSIYTLAMLPQDRMRIYISKFLNIVSLVYMYVIAFTIVLYISYLIIPKFMDGDVKSIGFILDTIYQLGGYIPYNIEMFIVYYVFGLSAVICTIFTFIILREGKTSIFKMIITFIIMSIVVYFIMPSISYNLPNQIVSKLGYDSLNAIICIVSSIIIGINLIISKNKLNKIDF